MKIIYYSLYNIKRMGNFCYRTPILTHNYFNLEKDIITNNNDEMISTGSKLLSISLKNDEMIPPGSKLSSISLENKLKYVLEKFNDIKSEIVKEYIIYIKTQICNKFTIFKYENILISPLLKSENKFITDISKTHIVISSAIDKKYYKFRQIIMISNDDIILVKTIIYKQLKKIKQLKTN